MQAEVSSAQAFRFFGLRAKHLCALALAVTLTSLLSFHIYHPLFPILWLLSLALLLPKHPLPPLTTPSQSLWMRAATLGALVLPCVVRAMHMGLEPFHGDTIIPAFFSATYNFQTHNFFGPFPDPPLWAARFAPLHFVIQKIFFLIFGESITTIRLSALPYVLVATIGVFFMTRALWGSTAALLAVLLYAFLPPALYIETEAFHFSSSTAVLMVFMAVLLSNMRAKDQNFMLSAGILCGLCYLMYYGSYVALPISCMFIVMRARFVGERATKQSVFLFFIALVCVLAPFAPGIYQFGWYPLSRISDVNIFHYEPAVTLPAKLLAYLEECREIAKQLFWYPVEGNGGYNFGTEPFLNPPYAIFLAVGILICAVESFKKVEKSLIPLALVLGLLTLVACSAPPPAFHRMSPLFPLLSILAMLPLKTLYESQSRWVKYCGIFATFLVVLLSCLQFRLVQRKERLLNWDLKEDLETVRYIQKYFPQRTVSVAAHPMFHYQAMLHFYATNPCRTFYHNDAIELLDPNVKYLYLIFDPEHGNERGSWEEQFQRRDPNGKLIKEHWKKFHLFVN